MIRKTTETQRTVTDTQSVTQPEADCNREVQRLFEQKPELQSVTLSFGPNSDIVRKQYDRL